MLGQSKSPITGDVIPACNCLHVLRFKRAFSDESIMTATQGSTGLGREGKDPAAGDLLWLTPLKLSQPGPALPRVGGHDGNTVFGNQPHTD